MIDARAFGEPGEPPDTVVFGRTADGLIGALGTLVLALMQGQTWGWGSPAIVALFAASAVLSPRSCSGSVAARSRSSSSRC